MTKDEFWGDVLELLGFLLLSVWGWLLLLIVLCAVVCWWALRWGPRRGGTYTRDWGSPEVRVVAPWPSVDSPEVKEQISEMQAVARIYESIEENARTRLTEGDK